MKSLRILPICLALVGIVAADGGRISSPGLQLNRCEGKDGVFLPIPGSCNQYIICTKGTAAISTCGEYHFDFRRSVCDFPAKAGCITFGPEPLAPVEKLCSGFIDGSKLPVLGSSSKFYLCMQENAFLQDCGSLQFDAETMQCVNKNEQPATPVLAPCAGIANGVKIPVPGNSRQYYFCMNNKAFVKDCGNMYFIVKYSACALLPYMDTSGTPPKTNNAILPPQEVQYDLMAQRMCKNQRLGERVAIPGTCSQYYICMGNTGIPKSCNMMQFNPITKSCDIPSNVQCSVQNSGLVIYGKHDALAGPSQEEFNQVCYGQRDGIFVASPGKCSEFFFCFNGQSYRKSCGFRHFSPITLSCVELEESNCVEARPAIQAPLVKENSCLGRDNGILLKHPTECGKFLMCDNYVTIEMNCPGGLHFNVDRNYCDWPGMAKCF